jgi:predicted DNA-binding protein (MmcQ/YjbR family)
MDIEALRLFCLSLPHTTEDMPFDEHVLTFRIHQKIFLLTNLNDPTCSFNAKCEPSLATSLRERYPEAIKPGWHMNKKHWNTIDAEHPSLHDTLIHDLITHSYLRIVSSLTRAQRAQLTDLPQEPTSLLDPSE